MQHPASEDLQTQASVFSDMRQIGLSLVSNYPPPTRLRYALGRSNHGNENDKYGTSRFRANPYFNTVTAIQMSNRRQWIIEI